MTYFIGLFCEILIGHQGITQQDSEAGITHSYDLQILKFVSTWLLLSNQEMLPHHL